MIDCHCHLADAQFAADIDDVVERAKVAGVNAVLVCSESYDQFDQVFALSERYQNFCFPCIGVHPLQGDNVSVRMEDLKDISEIFAQKSSAVAAIGEVGLDFSPRFLKLHDAKDVQKCVLRYQIELAKKHNLPLNIHSRSAGLPTIKLLLECGASRVLMHAFDGNAKNAKLAIDAGYYFSIPPSFSRSELKRNLVAAVPLSQLCLETDSPVLGPSRTERNEPSNIGISAQFIADVKGISVNEVVKETTRNAIRLFPILNHLKLNP